MRGIKSLIHRKQFPIIAYDSATQRPALHASICTGETVAGFKDLVTGGFEEVMLIRTPADLETFKRMYGIEGEIPKEY